MSTQLIMLGIDDNLNSAKKIFEEINIHHILVKHDEKLLGVFTDRDLYKHLSPNIGTAKETHKDTAFLQKKIHLIMNRNLVTAHQDLSLNEAVLLFYQHNISCLPIVNDDFQAIGIVTWRDILKILALQYLKKSE